jgi:hemolysin activation/secretion protein
MKRKTPARSWRAARFVAPMIGACLQASIGAALADAPQPPATPPAAPSSQPQPNDSSSAKASAPTPPKFDLEAYDVDGNTLLDTPTIEAAVYPFLGPDRTRDDVAAARDALQKAYQSRGYQSVVVEVPQQNARSGIVRFHIVEAPVGKLRVVDSQYHLPSRIKEQVPSLREGRVPNFTEAQKEVAELNRLPDSRVTPLVKPGRVPGTVDIDLKVNDALPVQASLEVNNDHSQNTSFLRTIPSVTYSNLWQLGHSFTATATLAPENINDSEVFSANYMAPIWDTPWTVMAYGYYSNSNVATLGGTNALGKGYGIGVRGILGLPQISDFGLGEFAETFTFGADFKQSYQDIYFGGKLSPCDAADQYFIVPHCIIYYAPLFASYKLDQATASAATSITASVTAGIRGAGSGKVAFQYLRANAQSNFVHANLEFTDLRELYGDVWLSSRVSAQISDQPLVPAEQFSLGGLTSLRGYLQSEAIGDDGIVGSLELRSPSLAALTNKYIDNPWIDDWRFYVFTDDGVARVIDTLPGQQSTFGLASFGGGTRLQLFSHFTGDVLMGMPLRNGPATKAWHPYTEFTVRAEL